MLIGVFPKSRNRLTYILIHVSNTFLSYWESYIWSDIQKLEIKLKHIFSYFWILAYQFFYQNENSVFLRNLFFIAKKLHKRIFRLLIVETLIMLVIRKLFFQYNNTPLFFFTFLIISKVVIGVYSKGLKKIGKHLQWSRIFSKNRTLFMSLKKE